MNKEIKLRRIPDFPGYFVNDLGEIWSEKWCGRNKNGKPRKLKQNKRGGGYFFVRLWKNNKCYYRQVSRLVLNAPPNKRVDHKNRIKTDDKEQNLRLCTNTENAWNTVFSRGKSMHRGVAFHAQTGKWCARIRVGGGIRLWLGYYKTEIEAAIAWNRAAKKHHGEFATQNEV